jgi:hypothetical protein
VQQREGIGMVCPMEILKCEHYEKRQYLDINAKWRGYNHKFKVTTLKPANQLSKKTCLFPTVMGILKS